MTVFFCKVVNVEEDVLPLAVGSHPQADIPAAVWLAHDELECQLLCIVAFLEGAVSGIGRVLIVCLGEEFG